MSRVATCTVTAFLLAFFLVACTSEEDPGLLPDDRAPGEPIDTELVRDVLLSQEPLGDVIVSVRILCVEEGATTNTGAVGDAFKVEVDETNGYVAATTLEDDVAARHSNVTTSIGYIKRELLACVDGSRADKSSGSSREQETSLSSQAKSNSPSDRCEPTRPALQVGDALLRVPHNRFKAPAIKLRVGEEILLKASVNCAYTVSGSPQDHSVMRVDRHYPGTRARTRAFVAVAPGRTYMPVTMPMCALSRGSKTDMCLGGISVLGMLRIVVTR